MLTDKIVLNQFFKEKSVRSFKEFCFHAKKTIGISDGYWAKELIWDSPLGKEHLLKTFDSIIDLDTIYEEDPCPGKLSIFIEFIASDIFALLLPKHTPKIQLIVQDELQRRINRKGYDYSIYPDEETAISSKKLDGFETVYQISKRLKKEEFIHYLSDVSSFEKYIAVSLFMGNLDWRNVANFGVMNKKITAIDFGLAFVTRFSKPSYLLHHLYVGFFDDNALGKKRHLSDLFTLNLNYLLESVECILTYPVELWHNIIKNKIYTLKHKTNIQSDYQNSYNVVLNSPNRDYESEAFEVDLSSFEKLESYLIEFINHQYKLFQELKEDLSIISRYKKEESYFTNKWLQEYKSGPRDAITVAAIRDIKLIEGGQEFDAVDWAVANNRSVYGIHPLSGVLGYCQYKGIINKVKLNGITVIPSNKLGRKYITRDKKDHIILATTVFADHYTTITDPFSIDLSNKVLGAMRLFDHDSRHAMLKKISDGAVDDIIENKINYFLISFLAFIDSKVIEKEDRDIEHYIQVMHNYTCKTILGANCYKDIEDFNFIKLFCNISHEFNNDIKEYFESSSFDQTIYKDHSTRLLLYFKFDFLEKFLEELFIDMLPINFYRYEWGLGIIGKYIFEIAPTTVFKENHLVNELIKELLDKPIICFPEDYISNLLNFHTSRGIAVIDL